MPERRDAPDAYREYVGRRRDAERRTRSATGAAAPRRPVAVRREPEYLTLALLLSAVEFALISVAAAVSATATDGWASASRPSWEPVSWRPTSPWGRCSSPPS